MRALLHQTRRTIVVSIILALLVAVLGGLFLPGIWILPAVLGVLVVPLCLHVARQCIPGALDGSPRWAYPRYRPLVQVGAGVGVLLLVSGLGLGGLQVGQVNRLLRLQAECREALQFKDYAGALDGCQQAIQLAHRLRNRQAEGVSLIDLGMTYYVMGQSDQAIGYFQQALAVLQSAKKQTVEVRANEGVALNNIAYLYLAQGWYAEALGSFGQALALMDVEQQPDKVGMILVNMGQLYLLQGQDDQSLQSYQQALSIAQEAGDKNTEAIAASGLGLLYHRQERYDDALLRYNRGLILMIEGYGQSYQPTLLSNLAALYLYKGRYDLALGYMEQTLIVAQQLPQEQRESLNQMGGPYLSSGQGFGAQALDNCQQALAQARDQGDRRGEVRALCCLGMAYYEQGQPEQSAEYVRQAQQLAEETGATDVWAQCQRNLAQMEPPTPVPPTPTG